MKLIAGSNSIELAKYISHSLKVEFIEAIIHKFEDGELDVHINTNLHNETILIIQSTSSPVNENLLELLLLVDAIKRAGARHITAVIPYLCYSRQDCIIQPGASSLAIGLIANLLECAGANKIITVDIHSIEALKFFKIPIINLSTCNLFLPFIDASKEPVIVAPDKGSSERALKISKTLKCDLAIINKDRIRPSECKMVKIKGDVQGRHCVLIDDIIDSAGTICKAADFLFEHGATSVEAFVTHGIFSSSASALIEDSKILQVYATNTIRPVRPFPKLKLIQIEDLIAKSCMLIS